MLVWFFNYRKFDDTLRLERPDIGDEEVEKLREQNLVNWLKHYVSAFNMVTH